MAALPSADILKEIEAAIDEGNMGRMYDIGTDLIGRVNTNAGWIQAVLIISDYLLQHPNHVWNALALSRQAALAAPDRSSLQQSAINALLKNIGVMPTPEDRTEAACTVVMVAPRTSVVLVIYIDVMLDNAAEIKDGAERRRYTKIALFYAPQNSDVRTKAEAFMHREEALLAKTSNDNKDKETQNDPLQNFLQKHRAQFENITGQPGVNPKVPPPKKKP
jgi:hypothetical protein